MDLLKDTQVDKKAVQSLHVGRTGDAFATRVVSDKKPDDLDPNMVDFRHDDAEDPLNWSPRYKWSITMLLALMAIIVLRPS